ncbi:MAG: ABC transporter permease [Acetatifactor sp.]|nr:ABC transporter permease [Acetatifactor sp.]
MKIWRLSLFNLKKNKREAIGIAFLTLVTTLMLSIFVSNQTKINTAFDESFKASGSVNTCIRFEKAKYHDTFRTILEKEYKVERLQEGRLVYADMTDVRTKDGDEVSYNMIFVTEKVERKMESFKKGDQLPNNEIDQLSHPIWLPSSFQIVKGYVPGDTFTVLKGGKEYPLTVAGFYETGLMSNDGGSFKIVVTEGDYEVFTMLFQSSISAECIALFFDAGDDFDYEKYLNQCIEAASENMSLSMAHYCYKYEKSNEVTFLEIFMLMIICLAFVTFVASLFLIRHKISNDIEDQMQQIGVLEALGYRSKEISLAYLYEYVLAGGSGAVLGGILTVLITPFVNYGIRMMMGRNVVGTNGIGGIILVTFLVILIVVLFALLKARQVKNYPPVIALRKGIRTHHFGRNVLPLEKYRGNVNLGLAMKGFLGNAKSIVGVLICIVAAGTAILFSALIFDFFKDDTKGLQSMMGTDTETIRVHLMSGAHPEQVKEELLKLPEVRKVVITHEGTNVSVKGTSDDAYTTVYDDFANAEQIKAFEGRCPERANEVMIGLRRSRDEGIGVGDAMVLEVNGIEKKYIVTGVIGSLHNGGSTVFMTKEGYERLNYHARAGMLIVYPEKGVELKDLEAAVTKRLGGTAKDAIGENVEAGDLEAKVKAAAEEKIATLLTQYGVTDLDYAVQVGDQLITGNSRDFVVREITSYEGIIKTQMLPIARTTKGFSFAALILIAVIVAVILYLITTGDVRRQRQSLGIMKGLGYSSKDLMTQIALKQMPVVLVGILIASVCSYFLNQVFWGAIFATIAETHWLVIISTDLALVVFCYLVTYLSAGKIKKISVNELMTE